MLLDDGRISAGLTPQAAVAAMRQAIADAERGVLAAPARVSSDLGQGRLIFTTGARAGEWFGYRSYDTFGAADIVILATSSPVPVLDPSWLAEGCHVTSLGPKQRGRAEFARCSEGPHRAEQIPGRSRSSARSAWPEQKSTSWPN